MENVNPISSQPSVMSGRPPDPTSALGLAVEATVSPLSGDRNVVILRLLIGLMIIPDDSNTATAPTTSLKAASKLIDDDVVISNSEVYPEIQFSNRINKEIDAKLANEVSIIDMDNDYYLVRFALEDDYERVLTRGPHKILAWVRLLGLPYHYYKSLFRAIANMSGEVTRIDFNTQEGLRGRFARLAMVVRLDKPLIPGIMIDGIYQPIEYEGLPVMAREPTNPEGAANHNKKPSVDNRFGPWMLVVNRRRQPGVSCRAPYQNAPTPTYNSCSRFGADGADQQCPMVIPRHDSSGTGTNSPLPVGSNGLSFSGSLQALATVRNGTERGGDVAGGVELSAQGGVDVVAPRAELS
ncbi:hypothetical protein GQ457_05G029130 [Hibiscus cannabinus]